MTQNWLKELYSQIKEQVKQLVVHKKLKMPRLHYYNSVYQPQKQILKIQLLSKIIQKWIKFLKKKENILLI
jgi:hypothetical protein